MGFKDHKKQGEGNSVFLHCSKKTSLDPDASPDRLLFFPFPLVTRKTSAQMLHLIGPILSAFPLLKFIIVHKV
jgi:hypothetical protein